MTFLLAPPTYTGLFATIHLAATGHQLTEWRFGVPLGHATFPTEAEAVSASAGFGLVLASKRARAVFEEDVRLAGLK